MEDVSGQPSSDMANSLEVLSEFSSELTVLRATTEYNQKMLDEIGEHLSQLREVLDFTLNVRPDRVKKEDEHYPTIHWLKEKLDLLEGELAAVPTRAPVQASLSSSKAAESQASEKRGLEQSLKEATELIHYRLDTMATKIIEQTTLATVRVAEDFKSDRVKELSSEEALSPYNDLDLRIEDLRNFLDERTRRQGIHENFFYMIVILLLVTNVFLGVALFMKP